MDVDLCKKMSPTALLPLLLLSVAGRTAVPFYPSRAELKETANGDEGVENRNVAAGPDEPFDATRSGQENDVSDRYNKEKHSKIDTKRDTENSFGAKNKLPGQKTDVDVKNDLAKPVAEQRDIKGKSNAESVSPSKENVAKDALVNRNVGKQADENKVDQSARSQTANVEESVNKNIKGRNGVNSKVNGKDAVDLHALSGEKQDDQDTEKMVRKGSQTAAKSPETVARSANHLLSRQSVPISRVAFESDLESLSPELRELQQGNHNNVPLVSQVIDDIRKMPMVSRIRYAKETLFPPAAARPIGVSKSRDTQIPKPPKTSYKESRPLQPAEPVVINLMNRMQSLGTPRRLSPEEQLKTPIPQAEKQVVDILMNKLQKLAKQFNMVAQFIRNTAIIPELPGEEIIPEFPNEEWPPARFDSMSDRRRKLNDLSNKLAALRKNLSQNWQSEK